MLFNFKVEVLEGFDAWFLQSFYTSKCFQILFDAAYGLDVLVCRNSLGRLLFIGVWGLVNDTWWSLIGDMCHSLIGGVLRLFFPRHMTSFDWPKCFDFEAWFLQSFYTSKCFWIFFDAAYGLDVLVCRNSLGRLLFIGVWGLVSDTWWSLIGDMCHSLIGGVLRLFFPRHMTSFDWPKCFDFQGDTCQHSTRLPMSLLTHTRLLTLLLTCANV